MTGTEAVCPDEDLRRPLFAQPTPDDGGGDTLVEIAIPSEEALVQIEAMERLGLRPLSVRQRGTRTRIMYRLPLGLSLTP